MTDVKAVSWEGILTTQGQKGDLCVRHLLLPNQLLQSLQPEMTDLTEGQRGSNLHGA